MKINKRLNQFIDYCWSFYGPTEVYGHFFEHTLTKQELTVAARLRYAQGDFEGDSFDREAVRDIALAKRSIK